MAEVLRDASAVEAMARFGAEPAAEWLATAGARHRGFIAHLGAGTALTDSAGAPSWRVVASVQVRAGADAP